MDKIKNSMFLRLFIFICFFFQMNCYYFQNTHFLISAKLNGTSPVVSLNQLKPKSNYANMLYWILFIDKIFIWYKILILFLTFFTIVMQFLSLKILLILKYQLISIFQKMIFLLKTQLNLDFSKMIGLK